MNSDKSARKEVEASHRNKIDKNPNVICYFYFVYVLSTDFYHSWNRNIVPNSPESWEALTR